MIITENGIMIRTRVEEISQMGRNTQGVRVINLKDGDAIADVSCVTPDALAAPEADEDEDADEDAEDAASNGELDEDAAADVMDDAE